MHRIDTPTATPDNRFTEGDPAIPVAATVVSADWLNAVQEELAAVITWAGLELDKADNAQLRQAISQAITAAKPGLATTKTPGLVQIGDGLTITAQGLLSVLMASASQAGIMRPDGITCTVVGGVLSSLAVPYNTRLVITESNAAWTPPVTGWARVTVIGGGGGGGGGGHSSSKGATGGAQGGTSSFGELSAPGGSGGGGGSYYGNDGGAGGGGGAGEVTRGYVYLSTTPVAVIVGAGGAGGREERAYTDAASGDGAGPYGGFGAVGLTGGTGAAGASNGQSAPNEGYKPAGGSGGRNGTGFGGGGGGGSGYYNTSFVAPGGAAADGAQPGNSYRFTSDASTAWYGGAGGPGAIIIEYYDPDKKEAR